MIEPSHLALYWADVIKVWWSGSVDYLNGQANKVIKSVMSVCLSVLSSVLGLSVCLSFKYISWISVRLSWYTISDELIEDRKYPVYYTFFEG